MPQTLWRLAPEQHADSAFSGEGAKRFGGRWNRRYGYDLTFSAPKSVSVIWAIADRERKDAISAAHDAAVAETLRHLESYLPLARRGHAGESREKAKILAGVYRHASSREQDDSR